MNDFNDWNYIILKNWDVKIIDLEQITFWKIINQPFLLFFRNEKKFSFERLTLYLDNFLLDNLYFELLHNIDYTISIYFKLAKQNSYSNDFESIDSIKLYDTMIFLKNKHIN